MPFTKSLNRTNPFYHTKPKQSLTCPICSRIIGRSLLRHLQSSKEQCHKDFLQQQYHLILSLYEDLSIKDNDSLRQHDVLLPYTYCLYIWRKYLGFGANEKRRKLLEQQAKVDKLLSVDRPLLKKTSQSTSGIIKKFMLSEVDKDIVIPPITYNIDYDSLNIVYYDETFCPICQRDIHATSLWNHLTKMRHNVIHYNFLVEQLNLSLMLFNDLTFIFNDKQSLRDRGLYVGIEVIKAAWIRYFGQERYNERKQLRRIYHV